MSRRSRRGFTLIEVIAAFAIALFMIGPIAGIIAGAAGSFAGLERSTARRLDLQAAGAAAMTAVPLQIGTTAIGDYRIEIGPHDFSREHDLERAGWKLYTVTVRKPGNGGQDFILQTVRIGRL